MPERAAQETQTMTGTSLDAVEYAVVSQALMAAGREMGAKRRMLPPPFSTVTAM
jgi:hypothetical protein